MMQYYYISFLHDLVIQAQIFKQAYEQLLRFHWRCQVQAFEPAFELLSRTGDNMFQKSPNNLPALIN